MTMPMLTLLVIVGTYAGIADGLTCRCFAHITGTVAQTYLNYVSLNNWCQPNNTCVAPNNTGCFRVTYQQGVYAFCGQYGWGGNITEQMTTSVVTPWQGTGSVLINPSNNYNCTYSNLMSNGACYCQQSDYCNKANSLSWGFLIAIISFSFLALISF